MSEGVHRTAADGRREGQSRWDVLDSRGRFIRFFLRAAVFVWTPGAVDLVGRTLLWESVLFRLRMLQPPFVLPVVYALHLGVAFACLAVAAMVLPARSSIWSAVQVAVGASVYGVYASVGDLPPRMGSAGAWALQTVYLWTSCLLGATAGEQVGRRILGSAMGARMAYPGKFHWRAGAA